MNPIRAIIVDDETAAQKTLSGMLKEFCPQVNVIGMCNNVSQAAQMIERLQPDLLFLDIQMSPYESGFDLAGRTKHFSYGVIFVTAYPQFAIKAINTIQPWAYLVKPFSADDLMESVRTACKKIVEKENNSVSEFDQNLSSIVVSDARKGKMIIRCSDILFCKSDQSIVEIHFLRDGKQTDCAYTYKSLRQIQTELPANRFFRIHHGYLVNLAYVSKVEKNGRGGFIQLIYGQLLPVSIKKSAEFTVQMEKLLG